MSRSSEVQIQGVGGVVQEEVSGCDERNEVARDDHPPFVTAQNDDRCGENQSEDDRVHETTLKLSEPGIDEVVQQVCIDRPIMGHAKQVFGGVIRGQPV